MTPTTEHGASPTPPPPQPTNAHESHARGSRHHVAFSTGTIHGRPGNPSRVDATVAVGPRKRAEGLAITISEYGPQGGRTHASIGLTPDLVNLFQRVLADRAGHVPTEQLRPLLSALITELAPAETIDSARQLMNPDAPYSPDVCNVAGWLLGVIDQ